MPRYMYAEGLVYYALLSSGIANPPLSQIVKLHQTRPVPSIAKVFEKQPSVFPYLVGNKFSPSSQILVFNSPAIGNSASSCGP